MKYKVLVFLFFFSLNLSAQYSVSGTKSFTLSKKEIKQNEITFQIENTSNQPFVAFDVKINGEVKEAAVVKMTTLIDDVDREFNYGEPYITKLDKKMLDQDIHFQNENSWSSELQFLPKNIKSITIKIENAGSKIENIDFNFFYPEKTENLEKTNEFEAAAPPPPISCTCPIPAYENRADWDPSGTHPAQSSPTYTTVTHLIVHHAAGPNSSSDWAATVRSIWNYHVNSNGWSDIGYNYLIDPNGVIYEGRGDNVLGAHFSGMNGGTMGVCLLGNYQPDAVEDVDPSIAMQNSLVELLSWKECDISADPLLSSYHAASAQTQMHISGHRDAGTGTECPGDNVYDILPNIRNSCSSYIPNCSFAANADLIVSALETNTDPVVIAENTDIEIAVANGGTLDAIETLNVALEIDGNLVQTFVMDSILAGQILNFTEPNYVFSSLGSHQICVYIDAASNETNTLNNSYCKTIEVEDSLVLNSDILAQNITADISNPMVSDEINFSFDLKNIGAGTMSETVQGKIIIDGVTKQLFTIPIIAPSQNHLKTFAYTFSQDGNHSVCIEANSPSNEVSIANNDLCKTFTIASDAVNISALEQDVLSYDVFPNPANDQFAINLVLKQKEDVNIALINALGQSVFEKQYKAIQELDETISLNNFAKGIYLIRLETAKGSISKKLFVQ